MASPVVDDKLRRVYELLREAFDEHSQEQSGSDDAGQGIRQRRARIPYPRWELLDDESGLRTKHRRMGQNPDDNRQHDQQMHSAPSYTP